MAQLKKAFHVLLGIFLLLIGVAGLVLPILNGVVFLLLGLILLSFESPYIEQKLAHYSEKNHHTSKIYKKLNTWMRKIFRKH
jgi:uncharacterized membrane protein YbaN (DUF454 family)